LKLILLHDHDVCPVVNTNSQSHKRCWKLREKDEFDLPDGLSNLMTGEEIYKLLSSGTYENKDHTLSVEVWIDDSLERPDIYVYHEDSWIRSLLRKHNIFLNTLESGSFLRTDERWELFFSPQKKIVFWNALSTVTGKKWSKFDKTYTLNPTLDLEKATEEFLEVITDIIPSHQIKEFNSLQNMIDNLLASHGFGGSSPLCRLLVSHEDRKFTVKLIQIGGKEEVHLLTNEFSVSPEEPNEAVLNGLISEIESGGLSQYNIENTTEFLERVSYLLDQLEDENITQEHQNEETVSFDSEDDFETELLGVIEEYRGEQKQGKDVAIYLAQSLKQLATLRLEQEQFDTALETTDECLELLDPIAANSLKAQQLLLEIQDLKAQIKSSSN